MLCTCTRLLNSVPLSDDSLIQRNLTETGVSRFVMIKPLRLSRTLKNLVHPVSCFRWRDVFSDIAGFETSF